MRKYYYLLVFFAGVAIPIHANSTENKAERILDLLAQLMAAQNVCQFEVRDSFREVIFSNAYTVSLKSGMDSEKFKDNFTIRVNDAEITFSLAKSDVCKKGGEFEDLFYKNVNTLHKTPWIITDPKN